MNAYIFPFDGNMHLVRVLANFSVIFVVYSKQLHLDAKNHQGIMEVCVKCERLHLNEKIYFIWRLHYLDSMLASLNSKLLFCIFLCSYTIIQTRSNSFYIFPSVLIFTILVRPYFCDSFSYIINFLNSLCPYGCAVLSSEWNYKL